MVDRDGLFAALGRLHEGEGHRDPDIGTAAGRIGIRLPPATAEPAAEKAAEDVPEIDVAVKPGKSAPEPTACTGAVVGIDPGVTELVVPGPFFLIAEYLVGLVHLFELLLGLFVAGVQIGVILFGLFAVRFLDLILRGALGDAENLVVIAFFCQ